MSYNTSQKARHAAESKRYRIKYKDKIKAERPLRSLQYLARLREEIFTAYSLDGLPMCQECNAVDRLSIDHINQQGSEHRTKAGRRVLGIQLYYLLRRSGYPSGYRTLCDYCNRIAFVLHQLGFDVSKHGFMQRARQILSRAS